jgi:hypothetical protein
MHDRKTIMSAKELISTEDLVKEPKSTRRLEHKSLLYTSIKKEMKQICTDPFNKENFVITDSYVKF